MQRSRTARNIREPELLRHHIRTARAGEAAVLTALALRSKASNGYDDAFMAACVDELTLTEATIASGEIFVAGDEEPFGMFRLICQGETGHVEDMFIAPEIKRQGVGKALWAHLEREARRSGCARLELDADPFAVAFYEVMGMRVTGQGASGSIPGRMLPRMSKRL